MKSLLVAAGIVAAKVFKNMPPYAQPAVLPTDTNFSSPVPDSAAAYNNRSAALFHPLCCWKDGSQPAQPNRNPIYLTASAANAVGSVQTSLSKLPRPRHLRMTPHLILGQSR
jgi:hypothetical protein